MSYRQAIECLISGLLMTTLIATESRAENYDMSPRQTSGSLMVADSCRWTQLASVKPLERDGSSCQIGHYSVWNRGNDYTAESGDTSMTILGFNSKGDYALVQADANDNISTHLGEEQHVDVEHDRDRCNSEILVVVPVKSLQNLGCSHRSKWDLYLGKIFGYLSKTNDPVQDLRQREIASHPSNSKSSNDDVSFTIPKITEIHSTADTQ